MFKYLTLADIQRKLKIPESTMREWMKKGIHEYQRKKSLRKSFISEIEAQPYKYFTDQRKIIKIVTLYKIINSKTHYRQYAS